MRESVWQLFVDESGAFSLDEPKVVVGGVLVPIPSGIPSWVLRECLARELPHVPWPPHAAYVNQPIMHALWAADPEVLAILNARCPKALARVRRGLAANPPKRPPREALQTLARTLRAHGSKLAKAWETEARRARRAVFRLLAAWGHHEPRPLLAVVASEAQAHPEAGHNHRYLSLLSALVERCAQLVSRQPGRHVVRVSAQRLGLRARGALYGVTIHNGWQHLTADDLGRCCQDATTLGVVGPERPAPVRCVPYGVAAFDAEVAPEHVFADFVVNAALRAVPHDHSLPNVERLLARSFSCPVWVTDRELPALCTDGTPAAHVRQAAAGQLDPDPARHPLTRAIGLRPWAVEQAQLWAEELRP